MQKNFDCDPFVFVHARRSIVGVPPISTLTILKLTIRTHIVSTLTISALRMLQRSIGAPGPTERTTPRRRQRKTGPGRTTPRPQNTEKRALS